MAGREAGALDTDRRENCVRGMRHPEEIHVEEGLEK
jgi:hypothetical protein